MAFGHGNKGRILLGKYDVSAWLKGYGNAIGTEVADVTTLTKSSKCYVMGVGDGKVSLSGFFDGATAALQAILQEYDVAEVDWPFLIAVAGYGTIGSRAHIGQGKITSYEIAGSVDDAVTANAEIQSSDGDESGVLLLDLTSRSSTVNASSVDNAASSANGGIAVTHCTAYASLTNIVVKVQHSTDNSSWADLVTFTTLTSAGYQFSEVAAGTTVNRYLRAQVTITGSGSYSVAVGFARR